MAENLALRHISRLLVIGGKTNTDFTLPEPQFDTDILHEMSTLPDCDNSDNDTINQTAESIEGQRLAQLLNNEQRCIFDEIVDSAQNPTAPDKHRLFFVDGPGGTGKTFLFATLISTLRGMGLNVSPIARQLQVSQLLCLKVAEQSIQFSNYHLI